MGRNAMLAGGMLLALAVVLAVGLLAGFIWGERYAQHRQFLAERELIGPVLAGDPAFEKVVIHENAGGGAFLAGEVRTADDLERLRRELVRVLGGTKAEFLTHGMDVERR